MRSSRNRDVMISRRALLKSAAVVLPALAFIPAWRHSAVPAWAAVAGAEADPYRLPRSVIPERYDLTMELDLTAGLFSGRENIAVRVVEPVQEIVLNATRLEISRATLTTDAGQDLDGDVTLEPDTERARIRFSQPIQPGSWTLALEFSGAFGPALSGLYRSKASDRDDDQSLLAVTQFESTFARRAFPCWDEPDFKAVFGVTLVVDSNLTAISNGPVVNQTDLSDDQVAITFGDTVPMSTYLVAFFVGPLVQTDPVLVNGVPVRVAYLESSPALGEYARDAGAFALRHYTSYFGLPYPASKLDFIAIPDFALGGMENLGAIAFAESSLLLDPEAAGLADLTYTTRIVMHEVSHQWFGDLVTMRWWNGLWLNEAFATFMEVKATDAYRPEWDVWVNFGADRDGAMATDALETTRPIEFPVLAPAEAQDMFDTITYQKGGAVLRMLEQHLGPDVFQRGVTTYLKAHRFNNAETGDLWTAMEAESGQSIRNMMDGWVFQPGFPLVTAELDGSGRSLTLTQQRFRNKISAVTGGSWQIPISLRFSGTNRSEVKDVLLAQDSMTIDMPPGANRVVVNAGGHGFYRVRYSPSIARGLTSNVQSNLDTIERLNLVNDAWASLVAGFTPVAEFGDLLKFFGGETNHEVWAAVGDTLAALVQLIEPADRAPGQAFIRALLGPASARLGWEPAPGEDELTGRLRTRLIYRMAVYGEDRPTQAKARELHEAYLLDPSAIDPNLISNIVSIVAFTGDSRDYDRLLERYTTSTDPVERIAYLYALPLFRDPTLLSRVLDLAMSDLVTPGDGPSLIGSVLYNEYGSALGWAFLKDHWDEIINRFDPTNIPDMIASVTALTQPVLAVDVEQFLSSHPVEGGEKQVQQHLEQLKINVAFRQRESGNAVAYFRVAGSP